MHKHRRYLKSTACPSPAIRGPSGTAASASNRACRGARPGNFRLGGRGRGGGGHLLCGEQGRARPARADVRRRQSVRRRRQRLAAGAGGAGGERRRALHRPARLALARTPPRRGRYCRPARLRQRPCSPRTPRRRPPRPCPPAPRPAARRVGPPRAAAALRRQRPTRCQDVAGVTGRASTAVQWRKPAVHSGEGFHIRGPGTGGTRGSTAALDHPGESTLLARGQRVHGDQQVARRGLGSRRQCCDCLHCLRHVGASQPNRSRRCPPTAESADKNCTGLVQIVGEL
jgi:hypothetical protein